MSVFYLSFIPNRGRHEDLLISFPSIDEIIVADTYHFVLDCPQLVHGEETGTIQVLNDYLASARVTVERMKKDDRLFVPLDWSDEYFGGIFLMQLGDLITLQYGYIPGPGISFYWDSSGITFSGDVDSFIEEFELETTRPDVLDSLVLV